MGATTVATLAFDAADAFGGQPAIRHQRDAQWVEITYRELATVAREIAQGLVDAGVQPGDRVAILACTRPEWTFADLGVTAAAGVVVPVYATSSPEECEWVIGHSGAVAVVCEDASQVAKIGKIRDRLPELRTIIVIDPAGDTGGAITLDELRARGHSVDPGEVDRRASALRPDDVFTIIYTSGTTGPPKGCVLTHDNFAFVFDAMSERGIVSAGDIVYLYLPLAHVWGRATELVGLRLGATIAYFGGDPTRIVGELAQVRPTYMPSVPRIFEKIFTLATAHGTDITPEVAAGVRGLFGGQLREATTGAAPIAPEILEFFYACGVPALEGYGMTETTCVITQSTIAEYRFGTVGKPMPGVDVRIADDGEILVRGRNVLQGYYRDEAATRTAIVDGWFHTGDLGSLDNDDYLTITGRKKDIIITSGGKNLAPANLENGLKQSRWISQAIMYGDRRPYPVALITLDPEEIVGYARAHGLPEDLAALAVHDDIRRLIGDVVESVNAKVAQVSRIKRFHILGQDFSQDAGELTPTLKIKRNVISARYAEVFEALYDDASYAELTGGAR